MCGIFGVYSNKKQNLNINKEKIFKLLNHRGPDDRGQFEDEKVTLLHTRLSIIDLKFSRQPIFNEDGKVLTIYNGEIYNFQELKLDLVDKGHRFKTKGDTEILVHLYEEYGHSCLEKINGMFAFAIYDLNKKEIFIARDRVGIKPLYYYNTNGDFVFSSEIKPILSVLNRKNKINYTALWQYFTFQNVIDDSTLFDGINILYPGHYLIINEKGIIKKKYYTINFKRVVRKWNFKNDAYKLRYLLDDSIHRQLVSDVKIGSYLSGGIDSSIISFISKNFEPDLKSFTCGFNIKTSSINERAFDESVYAEEFANKMSIDLKKIMLDKNSMQNLISDVVYYLEDLRVGISYQNYAVARLASKHAKVVLSWTGGDDLMAGYPWRYNFNIETNSKQKFIDKFYKAETRFFNDKIKKQMFTKTMLNEVNDFSTYDLFRDRIGQIDSDSNLNTALTYEAKTFLHGLLVVEDRLSMAHSIEVRVPFLDNKLIDFTSEFPPEYKFDGKNIKIILVEALKDKMPQEIFNRPKQGFITPDNTWFKDPYNLEYIKSIILNKKSIVREIINFDFVKDNIINFHISGKADYRFLIWSLLCFEFWCRHFLD